MASPYGRGIIGLLKQGWNEIPAFMTSIALGLTGITLGVIACVEYEKSGAYDPKHKRDYIVYRSDDPRVQRKTREWI